MYIYKIINLINKKVYIGETIKSIEKRYSQHIKFSENNEQNAIYKAMRKYGVENFKVEKICKCINETQLCKAEIFFIAKYKSNNPKFGYNMTIGGEGGLLNEQGLKNLRKAMKIVYQNPEFIENRRIKSTGKKHNKEAKEKISNANSKRIWSEESKNKISNFHKGKTISLTQRKQHSERMQGVNNPNHKDYVKPVKLNKSI